MTANITIDDQYGNIPSILNETLHIPTESLTLRVIAALGVGYSWTELPSISTFEVEGIFDLTSAQGGLPLCNGVNLSRVGLRLFGVRSVTFGSGGETMMDYGYEVFGDMHVDIPASNRPLEFDFRIIEFAGIVQLVASLKGNIWENAFGSGLDVRYH